MASINRAFSHTITTFAQPSAIWALWCDPGSWEHWDGGLKSARLIDPDFRVGATGQIIPRSGPPSSFTVTAVEDGARVVIKTRLPLAKLTLDRRLTATPDVSFTHHVAFTGPLAWLWASLFGTGFRRELPHTIARLAQLAEGQPA